MRPNLHLLLVTVLRFYCATIRRLFVDEQVQVYNQCSQSMCILIGSTFVKI